MGNTPSDKKSGASSKTDRRPTSPTQNSTNPSNNNNTNNKGNSKNTTAPAEEFEEPSDSSSGDYEYDNPQLITPSNPDANYSLLDLPNEILCLLIAHLEAKNDIRALMFTSKVFVDLVYYSWSRLSMRYDNKLTYHQFLDLPAERLQYLLELDISHCTKMTNALFNQILNKTPNLQVLKMKGCKRLTRPSFSKLAHSFSKFTSIDLRECSTEEICSSATFPSNPNLKELAVGLRVFHSVFKESLDPLTITCLNLKSKIIAVYENIKLNDLFEFVNLVTFKGQVEQSTGNFDFSELKELENLSLSNEVQKLKFNSPQKIKRLSFLPRNFDTTAFTDLVNLVSLKLKSGQNGNFIPNFTTYWFPKLEELQAEFEINPEELIQRKNFVKLDVPFKNKDEAIAVISANPNLTSLGYRAVLLQEVFTAIRSLKKLEHLQINQISLARTKPIKWKRLKALKSLCIWNASFEDVDALKAIKQIPKLEKLYLRATDGNSYYGPADSVAKRFSDQFEGFPKLKILILRDNQYYYTEREEALMGVKGLTYVECQRL